MLTADARDAVLSLKQVSVTFPKGTTRAQAEPLVARFTAAARTVGGCGGADQLGSEFHAEVLQRDDVKMRDLPPSLQQIMLPMQVGQATPPFGSIEDGVRVLVMCGRERSGGEPADLRRGLCAAKRGPGDQPSPALPARPSPRRGDRIR